MGDFYKMHRGLESTNQKKFRKTLSSMDRRIKILGFTKDKQRRSDYVSNEALPNIRTSQRANIDKQIFF